MILADTSVWIDHFRKTDAELQRRLVAREIAAHPFVVGELALGPLPNRSRVLFYLDHLPAVRTAQQQEVRQMVETHTLHNLGIGLVDAHLLAAALITPGTELWTRDTKLRKVAAKLGILCGLA
ncbi:MAG: type II toxin-antitoxin system VapC family toxin [Terracidiphilus sp.]